MKLITKDDLAEHYRSLWIEEHQTGNHNSEDMTTAYYKREIEAEMILKKF
jgi:hypothetical protein